MKMLKNKLAMDQLKTQMVPTGIKCSFNKVPAPVISYIMNIPAKRFIDKIINLTKLTKIVATNIEYWYSKECLTVIISPFQAPSQ